MPVYHTSPTETWITHQPVLSPDPLLGYRAYPGKNIIRVINEDGEITFSTLVGQDGFRVTRATDSSFSEQKKLYIFGMSYNFGWGVDTEFSFPWLVQQEIPQYDVRNYGINAYSHMQNLLWFLHVLQTEPPDIAIFSYGRKQRWWNVANPSFLQRIVSTNIFPDESRYPKAGISPNGELFYKYIPLSKGMYESINHKHFDLDEYYANIVSQRIFQLIDAKARERKIPCLLLTFEGWDGVKPMADMCAGMGWTVIDGELPHTPEFLNIPVDGHANAHGNRVYADRIVETVRRLEKDWSASSR